MNSLNTIFQTIRDMTWLPGNNVHFTSDTEITIDVRKTKTSYRFDSTALTTGFMSQKDKFDVSVFYKNCRTLYIEVNSWNEARIWILSKEQYIRQIEKRHKNGTN